MTTTAFMQAEMVLLYTAPKAVENEQQSRAYLRAIFASLDRMRPNITETEHIWEAFKREWKYQTWPTPVELCARLTKFRAAQASLGKATGHREHSPDGPQALLEHRPYSHTEFMRALDQAKINVAENHPKWAKLDLGILRCGEALLKNRDDQDRPRYGGRDAA